MGMLTLILLVFALVFFVIAALAPAEPWRWRLFCFGAACLAGAFIAGGLPGASAHSLGH